MNYRHQVRFAAVKGHDLDQNEAYFLLNEDGRELKLRFHDYDEIFRRPGLYEQIFYDRLRCVSPRTVGENLKAAICANGDSLSELRVLDFGAGNGIMGEVLRGMDVSRIVGADILPEARAAADRDRPGIYDEYFVEDFRRPSADLSCEIENWAFTCLTCVAALGFDDIPVAAFRNAMNFIENPGWIAFNIKETFLDHADESGFSLFIRNLIFSKYLDIHHMERYRHRLSLDGEPLYYYSLIARKTADIPEDFYRDAP